MISLSSGLYPKTSRYVLLRRFFQQAFSGARAPSPLYRLLGLRFPFRPGTLAVFRKCPVAVDSFSSDKSSAEVLATALQLRSDSVAVPLR